MTRFNSDATTDLQSIAVFMTSDAIRRQIDVPASFFSDPITNVLPSIVVSGGGPVLNMVYLVSSKHVCEIKILGEAQGSHVEFVHRQHVQGYRIAQQTVEIKEGDVVKAKFETAQIDVHLGQPIGFVCQLKFVGSETQRSSWLRKVMNALPIGLTPPE
jgi:hypothetical protein